MSDSQTKLTQYLLDNIAEIQKNIQLHENALKSLQEQLETVSNESLVKPVVAGSGDKYCGVTDYNGTLTMTAQQASEKIYKGLVFNSKESAEAYQKAIETFMELRRCAGSVTPCEGYQYILRLNQYLDVHVACVDSYFIKYSDISPCFNTREDASNAVEKLGAEDIKHMFKTFHSKH